MVAIDKMIRNFFQHRLVLHIGFWLAFYFFSIIVEWENEKFAITLEHALHLLVPFAGFISASYINLYYLIPRFMLHKRYLLYAILCTLTIIIVTVIFLCVQYVIHHILLKEEYLENTVYLFFHISFYCLFLMFISTQFYFMRRWMNMQDVQIKLQEADKQKAMSELKALKAQINPHFFFNALNNIYSLSLEKNPKTPSTILKLSELMSYILYESQAERVSVKKEVEFIENYIELEKSRFEDSLDITFTADSTGFENLQIAPLLFIAFIENAFKHSGCENGTIPRITISIHSPESPLLTLHVENTINKAAAIKSGNSGVGLENVKQRLALIYPGRHQLNITETETLFIVDLTITLQ